jgi:sirohydrochlorin ferrochelatase
MTVSAGKPSVTGSDSAGKPRKALVLVAHGSRRQASNDEVRELTRNLRAVDDSFRHVACAFLELAEPSIPEGLREAIAAGADEVVVLPYFLSAGRHVVTDIPAEVAVVQAEHPAIPIRVAPYLGAAGGVVQILLQQACGTDTVQSAADTPQ